MILVDDNDDIDDDDIDDDDDDDDDNERGKISYFRDLAFQEKCILLYDVT